MGRPPSPFLPLETRGRVFRALLEGRGVPQVAAAVGVSRQAVLSHAKALIRGGVLEQVSQPRRPLKVRAGKRADTFAAALEGRTTDRGGRSVRWKAHAAAWKFVFTSGPLREPEGARESVASGKRQLSWVVPVDGEEWTLCAHMGKRLRCLVAHAPPVWVAPEDVRGFDEERARQAEGVLRGVARRWGFAITGPLRRSSSKTEFALPAPGLEKGGVAGVSRVWVDGTPPPRALETADVSVVEAVSRLPEREAEVEERLGRLERLAARIVGREGRVLKIIEAGATRLLGKGVEESADRKSFGQHNGSD